MLRSQLQIASGAAGLHRGFICGTGLALLVVEMVMRVYT